MRCPDRIRPQRFLTEQIGVEPARREEDASTYAFDFFSPKLQYLYNPDYPEGERDTEHASVGAMVVDDPGFSPLGLVNTMIPRRDYEG